jgi:hypothetical protein
MIVLTHEKAKIRSLLQGRNAVVARFVADQGGDLSLIVSQIDSLFGIYTSLLANR